MKRIILAALLKDAILQAAEKAGSKERLVGYLEVQAEKNSAPFLALFGKVLPMQLTNAEGGFVELGHSKHVSSLDRNSASRRGWGLRRRVA